MFWNHFINADSTFTKELNSSFEKVIADAKEMLFYGPTKSRLLTVLFRDNFVGDKFDNVINITVTV